MSENSFALLIFTVIFALGFDVMNGFHDAANSIATIVSTRVLRPLSAVIWAAIFNLLAMFVFGPKVAETISQIVKIDPGNSEFIWIILAGLIGALAWDYFTWWLGLPTSSSHALIGGISGAGFAFAGLSALRLDKIFLVIEFIFLSPLIGYILGSLFMFILFWCLRKVRPGLIDRSFKKGQLFSAALYSLGHGANDAQKTMGVILALFVAKGIFSPTTHLSLFDSQTLWIILSSHAAISLGTFLGGWRIIKTMGMRITKLKPIGGFSAETAGAATLFFATLFGIPVSTTHTITGAIIGVGTMTHPFSRIRWGIATKIVWAWILTIPGSALIGALFFYLFDRFL